MPEVNSSLVLLLGVAHAGIAGVFLSSLALLFHPSLRVPFSAIIARLAKPAEAISFATLDTGLGR